MAPQSILIIGCGIAGPPLATFLLLSPLAEKPNITILERGSSVRPAGQNVDIRGSGATIIRKLGLDKIIRASTTDEEGVHFVDANDRVWATFAADKSGKIQTGTSDIEILRGQLAEILFRRSEEVNKEKREGGGSIEYIFGDYVESLEQDEQKVHVGFAKGKARSFDLVVGADGLQSRTRKIVFGGDDEERLYQLDMYGGFWSMPAGETDSLWRRWYSASGRRGIMVRPHTRRDKSTVFMFVINKEDGRLKDAAKNGNNEAKKAILAEHFQDAGWECGRLIKEMHAADDFYYDEIAQVRMDKWSKGRVVLLGDAGYCGSPISGMGTTLALNGAYNLAGAITRHPNDYTEAFTEYEEKMRPLVDAAQKLAFGGRGHLLLNPETAWGVWVKNCVLWFLSWTWLATLIAQLGGPPANAVPVIDYGFRQLPEWEDIKTDDLSSH